MMPKAYVVVEVDVQDAEGYAEYRKLSTAALEQYGGKFLVRGGAVTIEEGEWQPNRWVIVEFEDMAAARRWYESPEYTEAKALRQKYATSNLIIVEGVS